MKNLSPSEHSAESPVIACLRDADRLVLVFDQVLDPDVAPIPEDFIVEINDVILPIKDLHLMSPLKEGSSWSAVTLLINDTVPPAPRVVVRYQPLQWFMCTVEPEDSVDPFDIEGDLIDMATVKEMDIPRASFDGSEEEGEALLTEPEARLASVRGHRLMVGFGRELDLQNYPKSQDFWVEIDRQPCPISSVRLSRPGPEEAPLLLLELDQTVRPGGEVKIVFDSGDNRLKTLDGLTIASFSLREEAGAATPLRETKAKASSKVSEQTSVKKAPVEKTSILKKLSSSARSGLANLSEGGKEPTPDSGSSMGDTVAGARTAKFKVVDAGNDPNGGINPVVPGLGAQSQVLNDGSASQGVVNQRAVNQRTGANQSPDNLNLGEPTQAKQEDKSEVYKQEASKQKDPEQEATKQKETKQADSKQEGSEQEEEAQEPPKAEKRVARQFPRPKVISPHEVQPVTVVTEDTAEALASAQASDSERAKPAKGKMGSNRKYMDKLSAARKAREEQAQLSEVEQPNQARQIFLNPLAIKGVLASLLCLMVLIYLGLSMFGGGVSKEKSPSTCDVEYADGGTYTGECVGETRQGQGQYVWASGIRYNGAWDEGHMHGAGVMILKNGARIEGTWAKGVLSDSAVITWPNGTSYTGQVTNTKAEGQGEMTYATGDRYEGQFKEGLPHGEGIMWWALGARHEGRFKRGKAEGEGTYWYVDGSRYEGIFNDGRPAPGGTCYRADGSTQQGPCN